MGVGEEWRIGRTRSERSGARGHETSPARRSGGVGEGEEWRIGGVEVRGVEQGDTRPRPLEPRGFEAERAFGSSLLLVELCLCVDKCLQNGPGGHWKCGVPWQPDVPRVKFYAELRYGVEMTRTHCFS